MLFYVNNLLLSKKFRPQQRSDGRNFCFSYFLAAAAFQFKGLAVGAGNNGRIVFMSAHLDSFKAAVIVAAAVVLAVVYCTFDRSVCKFSSHFGVLLLKNWYSEINFFSYTCFYFSVFSQEYVRFFYKVFSKIIFRTDFISSATAIAPWDKSSSLVP